jgi:hypothetical protein
MVLLRRCAGGDLLHHWAADAFDAMHEHARRFGIDLMITDGYRPYATQERIFRERYTPSYNPLTCTLQSKLWDGNGDGVAERWWKRRGVATAAVPGTSNHGWGLAIDVHTVDLGTQRSPGPKLRFLAEFAGEYGFSWELLPEEPWHLRYIPGVPWLPHAPESMPAPPPLPPLPSLPLLFLRELDMQFVRATFTNLDGTPGEAIHHVFYDPATHAFRYRHVTGSEWAAMGEPAHLIAGTAPETVVKGGLQPAP